MRNVQITKTTKRGIGTIDVVVAASNKADTIESAIVSAMAESEVRRFVIGVWAIEDRYVVGC